MHINYEDNTLFQVEPDNDETRFILVDDHITVNGWDLYAHKFYSVNKDGYVRRR